MISYDRSHASFAGACQLYDSDVGLVAYCVTAVTAPGTTFLHDVGFGILMLVVAAPPAPPLALLALCTETLYVAPGLRPLTVMA